MKKADTIVHPKHKRFFELPNQTKETCAHRGGPVPVRGYNSYGQERSWKCTPGGDELVDPKDARVSIRHPTHSILEPSVTTLIKVSRSPSTLVPPERLSSPPLGLLMTSSPASASTSSPTTQPFTTRATTCLKLSSSAYIYPLVPSPAERAPIPARCA